MLQRLAKDRKSVHELAESSA